MTRHVLLYIKDLVPRVGETNDMIQYIKSWPQSGGLESGCTRFTDLGLQSEFWEKWLERSPSEEVPGL